MFSKMISLLLVGIAFLCNSVMSFAQSPELIPRHILFGNPAKVNPQLSPNGQWLAYLAPTDTSTLNLWLQDSAQQQAPILITHDRYQGIASYAWTQDGQSLLYIQDQQGDENWHVYGVNLKTQQIRDYTPFKGVRAQNITLNRHRPQQILVELNLRDRQVFDVYRIDLSTGAVQLDTQNPGNVQAWLADNHMQIRAALMSNNHDARTVLRVRDKINTPWHAIIQWPFGESGEAINFSQDGKSLLIQSNLASDTSRLLQINATTGKLERVLAQDAHSDIVRVLINENTYQAQAVQFNYLKPKWLILDPSIRADFARLAQVYPDSEFNIVSRDHADQHWLIAYQADNLPLRYYHYNRKTKQVRQLFLAKPALEKYHLAKMQPLLLKARDGMLLVSYLTLPPGEQKQHLPLVLLVHGGPWARDDWGYNATVQWLANRGYAVLQVNFRGSTGFGKRYLHAGNGQWGVGAMQHDLTDAVQWAIQQKIADAKKVCIYGGSYGGYATLAGLAFTPHLYACGVDIVGPSNVQTLLASIPAYWHTLKKRMLLQIGDVANDHAFNRTISPFFHADKIRAPLFIAQGFHDPRVNIEQSNTMVQAIRAHHGIVTYVVYTDEGHGFNRPENSADFHGRAEEFLAKYLQGRVEPWHAVPGASVEVH